MSETKNARTGLRSAIAALRGDGRGWVLLTVALGWFVILGLRFVVPALLPRIKADYGINNATAGVAITLIWLTYAGMQFPAGVLTDRLGERRLLMGSLLLGGAGVALFSVSLVFGIFLVACAVFGLGTGVFGPARGTVLSKAYPDNDGAAFGLVLAAGSIGAAAVPFVASRLAPLVGWRRTMGLFVPLFVLIGAGLWWAVPPLDREAGSTQPLLPNFAQIRAGVTQLPVVIGTTAAMLMVFSFQGLTAFLPTYLVATKGMGEQMAAGLFTGLFLTGAVFQSVAGSLTGRFGHGPVLVIVGALSVLPLVALPYTSGLVPLAVLVLVLGVRLAIGPVTNAYLVRVLPAEVMGSSWGLIRTGFFVVGSTGSVFVGVLADRGLFDESILALAVLTAIATVLYLLLPPRDDVI